MRYLGLYSSAHDFREAFTRCYSMYDSYGWDIGFKGHTLDEVRAAGRLLIETYRLFLRDLNRELRGHRQTDRPNVFSRTERSYGPSESEIEKLQSLSALLFDANIFAGGESENERVVSDLIDRLNFSLMWITEADRDGIRVDTIERLIHETDEYLNNDSALGAITAIKSAVDDLISDGTISKDLKGKLIATFTSGRSVKGPVQINSRKFSAFFKVFYPLWCGEYIPKNFYGSEYDFIVQNFQVNGNNIPQRTISAAKNRKNWI